MKERQTAHIRWVSPTDLVIRLFPSRLLILLGVTGSGGQKIQHVSDASIATSPFNFTNMMTRQE